MRMSLERCMLTFISGSLSGHVHQLFGASRLSPELSYESLQQSDCSTVGAADGTGNAQDKSIYWHPAMYAKKKNGGGYVKIPTNGHKLYYKTAGSGKAREPFEFPHGFRMVAGDPFMRGPASSNGGRQNITQWICHSAGGMNQGTDGGFPTGISDCDAYPGFNGAIHFPHCWNGDDYNPANPNAHMSYPDDNIQDGACPSSHPIRLPHIFAENQFNIHDVIDQIDTDSFVLAMGDNTGYGWHADFFNGWDDGAIPALMKSCPQGEYGNEDIGGCPTYKPFSGKKAEDCMLPTTYKENVNNPGKALPGCNPISDVNPAPMLQISPLNVFTTQCKAAAGGPPANPSGGSSSVAPPPYSGSSSSASSSQQSSTVAAPTMTMATYTRPALTQTASTTTVPSSGGTPPNHGGKPSRPRGKVSCPESNGQTIRKNGKTFKIECGIDHFGGNLATKTAHSLGECIKFCARTDGCVDVSLSGTACYLKKELGHEVEMDGLAGAKLVTGASGTDPASYGRGKRNAHIHHYQHAHGEATF